MKSFKEFLIESPESDKRERDIAKYLQSIGINAERPKASTKFADIRIEMEDGSKIKIAWLEVKMNHTDNLFNKRVFYNGNEWDFSRSGDKSYDLLPTLVCKMLNTSPEARGFVNEISKFSKIKKPFICTTKGQMQKEPNAVQLETMLEYFNQPGINRYFIKNSGFPVSDYVEKHYTLGKSEPAYYLQAKDDFYMITSKNPLNLPRTIPILKAVGTFNMRVGTRSEYYEVQPELKITDLAESTYSLLPGTDKKNPFEEYTKTQKYNKGKRK